VSYAHTFWLIAIANEMCPLAISPLKVSVVDKLIDNAKRALQAGA
jgi:hypothetical protein